MPAPFADSVATPRSIEATIQSTWLAVGGRAATDDLLDWPADMFAFTDAILDRTEAYRFVVSPPVGRSWPPAGDSQWREAVAGAARSWAQRNGARTGDPSDLIAACWRVLQDALDTPLDDIATGRAWETCEALLTLHAISDEACAG